MVSRPSEIWVHGLQPVAAFPAPIAAAALLRHDALEAQFAGLGEHDRALGDERFAEQDALGARNPRCERLALRDAGWGTF